MQVFGGRVLVHGGVAVLLGAVVACGQSGAEATEAGPSAAAPAAARTAAHARFDAKVTLDDGRQVGMRYAEGRGLVEQHYDPATETWSKGHLLYATKTDRCQSMKLKAFGDTVAVVANWATYCSDGEPPNESLAGVGIGDLSKWDTDLTKGFDGWAKVTASADRNTVTFSRTSLETLTRLRWTTEDGFSAVEEIPR